MERDTDRRRYQREGQFLGEVGHLEIREVHHCRRALPAGLVPHIGCDADYLELPAIFLKRSADSARVREEAPCKRGTDNCFRSGALVVGVAEVTAVNDRHPHRLEKPRPYDVEVQCWSRLTRGRPSTASSPAIIDRPPSGVSIASVTDWTPARLVNRAYRSR